MKNRYTVILGYLLIVSLFLGACTGQTSQPTDAPVSATATETATEAVVDATDEPGSFDGILAIDPANVTSDDARTVVGYLYEGLVGIQDGNIVGLIAESYTISADGLDYIFNLRTNVEFHDGTKLNADVVVLNFNRWFDPNDVNRGSGEYAAWAANFAGFKGETMEGGTAKSQYDGIEKVDEYTVLIHLNKPDPDFLTKMTDTAFSIISPNSFENGGDGGSGPYKVSEKTDVDLTLSPFDKYWNQSALPGENIQVPYK